MSCLLKTQSVFMESRYSSDVMLVNSMPLTFTVRLNKNVPQKYRYACGNHALPLIYVNRMCREFKNNFTKIRRKAP